MSKTSTVEQGVTEVTATNVFPGFQGLFASPFAPLSKAGASATANIEALVASAMAASTNAQLLGARAAEFSKVVVDAQLAAARDLASVKSVQDLIEFNTSYARSTAKAFVEQATTTADVVKTLTTETLSPLSARVASLVRPV